MTELVIRWEILSFSHRCRTSWTGTALRMAYIRHFLNPSVSTRSFKRPSSCRSTPTKPAWPVFMASLSTLAPISRPYRYHVAIIRAGLTGLRTAKLLQDQLIAVSHTRSLRQATDLEVESGPTNSPHLLAIQQASMTTMMLVPCSFQITMRTTRPSSSSKSSICQAFWGNTSVNGQQYSLL